MPVSPVIFLPISMQKVLLASLAPALLDHWTKSNVSKGDNGANLSQISVFPVNTATGVPEYVHPGGSFPNALFSVTEWTKGETRQRELCFDKYRVRVDQALGAPVNHW